MELIPARCVTLQICILKFAREFSHFTQCEPGFRKTMDSSEDEGLFITQSPTKADISAEIPGLRKTMDSSEDDGLFITQSSTKADISAEIPGFRKTMDSSEDEGLYCVLYYQSP